MDSMTIIDNCEYYTGCEVCGSVAHKPANCPKKHPNSRRPRIANKQSIKHTEKIAYVNGLKHNLISSSQLCDANFKVLFTKTQETIFNQYDEVVLIAPRRRYVYVIDMCLVHINNHIDHLGKFDEKADDGFFLGYSQSFLDDEFLEPRSKVTQCFANIEYFPYIPSYENTTPTDSPILQDSIYPEEPTEFTSTDNHPAFSEHNHFESGDNLEPAKIKDNVIIEPISDTQSTPKTSLPSGEAILQTLVPQDRWSREKHIELVSIIGEPLASITTRSKVRDSDAASAHECLYVNFLSEIEPKKLIEALKEG
ncbi:hypothetical protein Tco_1065359 [Tanacetum coccineum]